MDSKPWWKSKTVWFNVVAGTLEVLQVIPLPPGVSALVVGVSNIVLRRMSDEPIRFLPQK